MPVFLDAAGTLIHLREPVGRTYARLARRHGVETDASAVEGAFRSAWKTLPPPLHPENQPPADDDRSWWRQIVDRTFQHALKLPTESRVTPDLFETLYQHFARPDAWQVFPDVIPALQEMRRHHRLWVLSNFDRRLHPILEGLELKGFFEGIILSSEVGASKPHPRIFAAALAASHAAPQDCLHIGDDATADHAGASLFGLHSFHLTRPDVTLWDALPRVRELPFDAHSPPL